MNRDSDTNAIQYLWAARNSNLRLPPCEDGTLTAELAARNAIDGLSREAENVRVKNSDSRRRRQDDPPRS